LLLRGVLLNHHTSSRNLCRLAPSSQQPFRNLDK
jgi:hypothetical protein